MAEAAVILPVARKIQLELAKDNEPQQQQAVAKLDYRWFVTFDNYLRKKEQIIIKIDEN